MWRCQGRLEELSSVKRSKLCIHGSKTFLSFNGVKPHEIPHAPQGHSTVTGNPRRQEDVTGYGDLPLIQPKENL